MEVQYLTKNACYISGEPLKVKGVMVHSTGANNPRVSRYVPGNDVIGYNQYGNHWDQYMPGNRKKCIHAFIGKFADDSIGIVQTLPWDMVAWHAGGPANNTHIGFEICEDHLDDEVYFNAVYDKAVWLTAYLCLLFDLDPLADGVVICHSEGYARGIASGHMDISHWFPIFGKTMDDFRAAVARKMEEEKPVTYEQWKEYMDRYRKELQAAPVTEKWQRDTIKRAIEAGVSDGSRPLDFMTRVEGMAMALEDSSSPSHARFE